MLQNAMKAEAWIQEKDLSSNPRVDKKAMSKNVLNVNTKPVCSPALVCLGILSGF